MVTLTVEESPLEKWCAEDIDEIKALLDIWRKGQARVDRSRTVTGIPATEETPDAGIPASTENAASESQENSELSQPPVE